ncbi:MAG: hypothetical protein KDD76_06365 [Rickettsiales bacterium]|nr:hypothetical protein [Rickettsiales bacterium]
MFAAAGISRFLADTAVVEQRQMELAYMAGSIRAILVLGLIVFICYHVRRSFENKEVDVLLSRPITRETFVFSYWLGFALVALLLVLPMVAGIGWLLHLNMPGLMQWSLTLLLELWIVVAFGLFCSLILKSSVISVLLTIGFYIISRMMGFFLYVFERESEEIKTMMDAFREALRLIYYIVPRLDMNAKSNWLIYGIGSETHLILPVAQAVVYVPLILLMAIYDFRRQQF